jgi:hypothetical protein
MGLFASGPDQVRIPFAMCGIEGSFASMNDDEVQCPSCGEWFAIPPVAPEDYGSEMDYDCEVC